MLVPLVVLVALLGLTVATSCIVRTHPDRGRHGHAVKRGHGHHKHGKHKKHKKHRKHHRRHR